MLRRQSSPRELVQSERLLVPLNREEAGGCDPVSPVPACFFIPRPSVERCSDRLRYARTLKVET